MTQGEKSDRQGAERLFELPDVDLTTRIKPIALPVWTESKARLIQRYLQLFVRITKHGTYIDGFAGPQKPHINEYAAKSVIGTGPTTFFRSGEPARLRHFHLFDIGSPQIEVLHGLRQNHPELDVNVYHGDFNRKVDKILRPETLKFTEATFCLLDQRTFECEWDTVRRLADYKREANYKIEIFYFLASWWFDRAVAGLKAGRRLEEVSRAWWGRDDWPAMLSMSRWKRQDELRKRFQTELGYKYADSWPIYGRKAQKTRIMYFMIHATDHNEAPKLMRRAYLSSVYRDASVQLSMYPLAED
jgi:three-Cys-motif partner protein